MCNQLKKSLGNRERGKKTAINLPLTNIIFNAIHTLVFTGKRP